MDGQRINRVSGRVILVLSLAALHTVLIGYTQPPQPDEGSLAHIFQLTIVVLVLMIFVFLATADWKQPLRSARPLGFPAAALALAFGALYYLEPAAYVALTSSGTASRANPFAVAAPPPTAYIPNPASSADRLATGIAPLASCNGPSWLM